MGYSRQASAGQSSSTPPEPNSLTLANSLAERIRRDILAADLREGEVFLTEAQVDERYSVSRNITREAVSQLRALGVLKSRQGKGLLVARSNPVELLARSLPFYGREPEDVLHLAQWRYVLEIGAVELAVSSASPDQIDCLAARAGDFETAVTEGQGQVAENRIELAFHSLILEMTGNPLITGMHHLLVDYFDIEIRRVGTQTQEQEQTVWQHHAIAEAIRQRDIEQARVILRQHLQAIHYLRGVGADEGDPAGDRTGREP